MIQQFNKYLIYYFGQQYSKIFNILVLLGYKTHYDYDTCSFSNAWHDDSEYSVIGH